MACRHMAAIARQTHHNRLVRKLQMTVMLTFADLIDQQEVITANDFGYPHRPLLALDQYLM